MGTSKQGKTAAPPLPAGAGGQCSLHQEAGQARPPRPSHLGPDRGERLSLEQSWNRAWLLPLPANQTPCLWLGQPGVTELREGFPGMVS